MPIIITILIFGVIVVIHEWGHFITAKKSGVAVPEFAVGMGPKIFSFKRNETMYSLRLFPVGGFCRMEGENEDTGVGSFVNAALWKRMVIICAGSFMNLVLAIFVFTLLSAFSPIGTLNVTDFPDNSPAKEAGVQAGDRITAINGETVFGRTDLSFILSEYKGGDLTITVNRGGKSYTYDLRPQKDETEVYRLGVMLDVKSPMIGDSAEGLERANLPDVIGGGIYNTYFSVKATWIGLVRLVTAQISIKQVSGPIGLTGVVGEVYDESVKYGFLTVFLNILQITGLLSANLCVMNMLPFPALDGGRFMFLLYELLRGKPVPPEKEGIVHIAGFAVLMVLGVIVAFNDVMKFL